MDLSEKDEEDLKRLLAAKVIEKGGSLTDEDQKKIFVEFLYDHQHIFKIDANHGTRSAYDAILFRHAKILHSKSVTRLHGLVDKIEKGVYDGSHDELMETVNFENPDCDCWEFELGDKVAVDLPKHRLKYIQKQTFGWTKKLLNIHGQRGYVTKFRNKYDCKVTVYFPAILTSTMVHASALSKTTEDFQKVSSRWKVGDFVKTKKSKTLLRKFQKRLPDVPQKYTGVQGRVIAISSAGVHVTFNCVSSVVVHPALLIEVSDPEPMSKKNITDHPKGFEVGMEVQIIFNLPKLIEYQKEVGGWNWKMTSIVGKTVRICQIKKDGSLIVAPKFGRTWRINFQSAFLDYNQMDPADFCPSENLPFSTGDVVRLTVTASIRTQLVDANLLESCLDLIKLPGKVEGIDKDLDVVVRFSNGKKLILKPSMIQNVSRSQVQRFRFNELQTTSLHAGCRVRISSGPPRYVEEILSKIKTKPSTRHAISQQATLLGFTDCRHAVMQYEDGRTIRINTRYVAPVEQIDYDVPQNVDFGLLQQIVKESENSVAITNAEKSCDADQNSRVDVFSVSTGSPPTICLRINSPVARSGRVIECLKNNTQWIITRGCENECTIRFDDSSFEVDVVFLTHEQQQTDRKIKDFSDLLNDDVVKRKEDETNCKRDNVQLNSNGCATFVAPPNAISDPANMKMATPELQAPGRLGHGFQYMNFRTDQTTIYIPHIPHEETHPESYDARMRAGNNTYNTNIIIQESYGRVGFNKSN